MSTLFRLLVLAAAGAFLHRFCKLRFWPCAISFLFWRVHSIVGVFACKRPIMSSGSGFPAVARLALIGSIRRECLDHILIFSERGLRRILKSYFEYYENHARTWDWQKTHRFIGPFNLRPWVRSLRSRRSAGWITVMNAWLLKSP